jgi:protein gp37
MGTETAIEWTDSTWSPVTGCAKVSPGCKHCYAERVSKRQGLDFSKVTLHPDRLDEPLHWRKPRRVFVCSMGDLFHGDVPDDFINHVWQIMAEARQHTFQVLTKRPERFKRGYGSGCLPNVWLGVSCENRKELHRLDTLRKTPAALRFVSFEPLLEDLGTINLTGIGWCIVGGESGGPPERALVHEGKHRDQRGLWWVNDQALEWVRSIRDQCQSAGVPFFFKQWGGWRPMSGGRLLDGREWNEYPA